MKLLELTPELEQRLAIIFDVALKSKGMEIRPLINEIDANIKMVEEKKDN